MSSSRLAVSRSGLGALLSLLSIPVWLAACQSTSESMRTGMRSRGTLENGETQIYQIDCQEGQFLALTVEQQGVDVVASLKGPDGRLLTKTDSFLGPWGKERILGIVPSSGSCIFEIEGASTDGHFESWIEEQRVANETDRRRVDAATIYTEGVWLTLEDDLDGAVAKFDESLSRWKELGDREWQSLLHLALGKVHANRVSSSKPDSVVMLPRPDVPFRRYSPAIAIFHLEESLNLAEDLPALEARAFVSLGEVHMDSYRPDLSLQYYEQALPLWIRFGDRSKEAKILNNLGLVHREIGELQKALSYSDQAIHLWRELGDVYEEANTLHLRGKCYRDLNRNDMALADFEKALEIWNQIRGGSSMAASTMTAMGSLLLKQGDLDSAFDYLTQALEIYESAPFFQSIVRIHLGMYYTARGENDTALEIYRELLESFRAIGYKKGEAVVLLKLGEIRETGDPDQALELFDQARRISLDVGSREMEVSALFGMARAERLRGRPESSRRYIEESLDKIDSLRMRTTGLDLQSVYFASKQDYYSFYIGLLMELADRHPGEGFIDLALSASERSRARSLLDLLSTSGVDLRNGDRAGLLEREERLERSIEAAYLRRERLMDSRKPDTSEVGGTTAELRKLLVDLDRLRSEIRLQLPGYANLTMPRPISSNSIQSDVLDEESLLLEYHLGEPSSYVFAVSKDDLKAFKLSGGEELKSKVQLLHDIMEAAPAKITLNRARLNVVLADLSTELLLPAAGEVLRKKRLLIVAHEALQHVPFGALPIPSGVDGGGSQLIDSHEVVFLPSTWALGVMRSRFVGRQPAPRKIAVLADPVFFDDPRLPVSTSRAGAQVRSTSDAERHFGRLVYSRREAERILEQVDTADSMSAIGFEATKEAALDDELRHYRFVHFATHSIVDTEFPEMSSLVFSRVDREGNEIDGFVRVYDVYKLDLNADMVALSACRTGDGKEIRGEGLVGWTYGFIFAGAKSVLVSLWDVDDEATSELMGLLYSNVFNYGLPPSLALRRAQLEIREQPRWRSPYYWAGFLIQGDFR